MLNELFSPKSPRVLGLDISSSSIKLLELNRQGNSYRVENYANIPLPKNVVDEKEFINPECVTLTLKNLLNNFPAKIKNVAIALPDLNILHKTIQIDSMFNEQEIEQIISNASNLHFSLPSEEVSFDFDTLGSSDEDESKIDVNVIATHKTRLDTKINAISEAGLNVTIADVESHALARACLHQLQYQWLDNEEHVIALVDIGETLTTFMVLSGEEIIFSRVEKFGGLTLTKMIRDNFNCSFKQAEERKKKLLISNPEDDNIIKQFQNLINIQIERALQYFFSSDQKDIEHIVLTGGTARLPGLEHFLSEKLSVPTTIADPFMGMSFSPDIDTSKLLQDAPALSVSCGLALRSFDTWSK